MGLFSFSRKNKHESSVGNSDFYSQADEEKPATRKRRQTTKRDEPVDPVLPEKKRARRRLVGAIALVLAAIIGLPMILDSEPKPLADDIAIQIPSKDKSAPIPPAKPAPEERALEESAPAAQTLSPNEEVVPLTAPVAVAPVKEAPATSITPSVPAPVVAATGRHDAAKKPHDDAAKLNAADSKSASAGSTKKVDDARARAILDGKSPAADSTSAKTSGKVALQVAALATQEKVSELQKKLQSAGFKSYTQKVATQSGDRIRVRVGPFANDAEAEKARAKLGKIGLTGKLVPA
jgi:DedD protein